MKFFLKPVAAMTATKANFLDVPLINWKYLAGTGTTHPIDKASPLFGQRGTGEEQIAATSTLPAITLADKELCVNILFSEMDQPETSGLTSYVKEEAGIPDYSGDCADNLIQ